MTIPNPPLHCPLTNPSSSRHFLHSQDVNGGRVVHVGMITPHAVEVNMFGSVSIANFRTDVLYYDRFPSLRFCGERPSAPVLGLSR